MSDRRAMTETLGNAELELLRRVREVRIETTGGPGAPVHRTIIWVVVDSQGRVLIRSYRGATARWYREALAHPDCRLHVGERVLDVIAVPAADAERVAACSAELLAKYVGDPATPSMTSNHLDTTLELIPR